MASSGGKKGKRKWKQVSISNVESGTNSTSWAEEVDKVFREEPIDFLSNKQYSLPTAPRASRGTLVDESKIPTTGPFQAQLSNVPYDLNDEELANVFQDLNIKSTDIARKGTAYVEFGDRQSLITALNLGLTNIKGRQARIELPSHGMDGGRGGSRLGDRGGRGGNRDGGGSREPMASDRTNWRQARSDDDDRGHDRGSMMGGGGGRREFSSSSFSRGYDRDRDGGGGGGGGGGFYKEERSGYDRSYPDRYSRSGGYKDDEKDRYNDRMTRGGGSDDRSFSKFNDRNDSRFGPKREDSKSEPLPRAGETKTRMKLNLKPRSEPTQKTGSPATAVVNQSIFGGAKPVDTSARDREIEARLAKHTEHFEGRGGRPGAAPASGRSKGDNWSDDRRVEPAPPPKDNPWGRKTNLPVNNGRSSPDEDVHPDDLPQDVDSSEEGAPDEPRREEAKHGDDDSRGKGSIHKSGIPEKSRGKGAEIQLAHKQRESRKDVGDELAKMPKFQEASTPNFAGQNKFSSLVSDESCVD